MKGLSHPTQLAKLLFLPVILSLFLGSHSLAQGTQAKLEKLTAQYEAKVGALERSQADLSAAYGKALENLESKATQTGDLNAVNVVKRLRSEWKSKGYKGSYTIDQFMVQQHPEVGQVLLEYLQNLEAARTEAAPETKKLVEFFIRYLKQYEIQLTKEKNLAAAVQSRQLRSDAEAELVRLERILELSGKGTPTRQLAEDRPSGKLVSWGNWNNAPYEIPSRYRSTKFVEIWLDHFVWAGIREDGRVVTSICPGFEDNQNVRAQADVPGGLNNVVKIHGHSQMLMALEADGDLVCWGHPNDFPFKSLPAKTIKNVVECGGGYRYAAALHRDGTLTLWGELTENPNISIPAHLLKDVAHIAAAVSGLFIFKKSGEAYKLRHTGDLMEFGPGYSGVYEVHSGLNHCVGLRVDGSLFTLEGGGELEIPNFDSEMTWLGASRRNSFARDAKGTFTAWGQDLQIEPAQLRDAIDLAVYSDPGWVFGIMIKPE